MSDDLMYVVIHTKALAIDHTGTPIICDLICDDDIEYVDWDSAEPIDWLDLSPSLYQLYKNTVDFLHSSIQSTIYVK